MSDVTIIEGGKVFDTKKGLFKKGNVYVRNGKIIDYEEITSEDHVKTWDAEGRYVAPGFIDIHVHVFENHAKIGINADKIGIEQGVTTIVDAGSTGLYDFSKFKNDIMKQSVTEVKSFLNISKRGLVEDLSELSKAEYLMQMDEWHDIKNKEADIVGLKARMSQSVVGEQGIKPLEHAMTLLQNTNVPIMVHIGSPPPPLHDILPLLRKGDIVTHAFHGKKGGILDESGMLIQEAKDALERGVRFDVGHGTSSFSYQTIKQFKQRYQTPFTISTDLYEANYEHPVGSLCDTISKLLAIGYSLEELIQAVTIRPAEALSLKGYGALEAGNQADITVFEKVYQSIELMDSYGGTMIATERVVPYATWKYGQLEYKRS